ncbi:MAG: ABC transporter ATP-binding protein [Solirubrobacterales bacterium]
MIEYEVAPRERPVIQIDDLVRTYVMGQTTVRALRGVTLTIERGEYVAIMGPSGSGKSTLMNTLGCLDAPTSGTYLLDGVDVRELDEDDLSDLRNRKIGFVFQGFNLVPKISAVANVELPLVYAGLTRSARRHRAVRALQAVGMGQRLDHGSNELSGGQQQRVAIARAIVTNPALVLADEPTGNLDSRSTEDVLRIFEELNSSGRTVVMITHEDDVARHADRLIRLADGRIVADRLLEEAEATEEVGSRRQVESV